MDEHIFVEGNEKKFISDLLTHMHLINPTIKISPIDGWTNLFTETYINILKQNTNNNVRNLVILDADTDFHNRQIRVNEIKNTDLDFELFLITNLNTNSGKIEDLLLSIILPTPQYSNIFKCFDNFVNCVKLNGIDYPDILKSKFFAFTSCTGQNRNISKIDFNNSSYYNLNHPCLDLLKQFLIKNIS